MYEKRTLPPMGRRLSDSGAVLVRADLVDLVRGDGWLVHVTAQKRRDVQLRGLSARRSVRFRSHNTGRERNLDTTDGVGAKPPARERRAPADWRPGRELMPLEVEMVASAAAGELVDCGSGPFDVIGNALTADGIRVGGEGVLLDSGFTAAGAACLSRAAITGALSCEGARLTGRDREGRALVADGIKVSFDVFLDDGFEAASAVSLLLADITGMLSCQDARLTGCDDKGRSIAAYGMRVTGDVWLDKKFTAGGEVSLRSSHIGGTERVLADGRPAEREGVYLRQGRRCPFR